MHYKEFILNFLKQNHEKPSDFAKRAGVARASVYRAMQGKNLLFSHINAMIKAANGQIVFRKI